MCNVYWEHRSVLFVISIRLCYHEFLVEFIKIDAIIDTSGPITIIDISPDLSLFVN